MKTLDPKNYPFSTTKKISNKQLEEHYKLYLGYINATNKILKESVDCSLFQGSNPTYSDMRAKKLGETFALNGVKLHEMYFQNITSPNKSISRELLNRINEEWISFDNFMCYLKNVCLSVRGWAIVCYDPLTDSLKITGSDLHDYGPVWCSYPILIIDVYEHAYFMDFGTNRGAYVDAVFENLNWEVISKRFKNAIS